MTTIALRHRPDLKSFCKPDSDVIDFVRVKAHLEGLRGKYDRSLTARQVWQSSSKGEESHVAESRPLDSKASKAQTPMVRIRKIFQRNTEDMKHNPKPQAKDKTGTVVLKDESDLLWHGPVTLGGQTFEVEFDTASSDFIINKSTGAYKPGATSKSTGKTFKIMFCDESTAEGNVYTDTLQVGGLKADGVAVGLAEKWTITTNTYQGIAGMAFDTISEMKQPPFFDALINAGVLEKPMFTFMLRDHQPTLTLGGIPDDVDTAPLWVDVDSSQGFWSINGTINGVAVKGVQDTCSSFIVAPVAFATALFAKLGLDTFTRDGTLYAKLKDAKAPHPIVTIQFGNFVRTLSPETVTFGTTDDDKPVLSIVGIDIGDDTVTFGDPWMRNVVAVFSREEKGPKIGFVAQ